MSVIEQDEWAPTTLSKEDRNWSTISHISTISGCFIPLANVIAPFIIWWMKKDAYPYVGKQAKEAMDFQISMTLYLLISIPIIFIVIGIPIIIAVAVFDVVMTVVAAVKANEGKAYRYPFTFRLL